MNTETSSDSTEGLDVAIIGLSGRFPGAKDLEEFWRNLSDGVEAVSVFTDRELADSGVDQATIDDPHYVKAGAVLDDVELFDAPFFGFYPREAEIMDPQHRVFLECAWTTIEQAGYNPEAYPGLIGVFAGTGLNTYLLFNLFANQEVRQNVQDYQITIGSDKDFLPTRVSYKLNLRGPSINIQTACSTSLVSVHLACQSLLGYQCDMALAGGVGIRLPQKRGYNYQEGGIISPDGHCRAFDADAEGTVSGNGVGVVLLKRLADAIADGDTIHAVIKGSAINNDGAQKVGYTAPSVDGQADVIATAQAVAGVEPETISYIEAHGTGTAIGDPIEIAALNQVFQQGTDATGFCAIGSVKTNIGHLDAAAGIAGLIKTMLALKHKQLPPSLNFRRPNPVIDFANSPFYVNTELRDWESDGGPRRAGVSSFGIGGTNAHVILEEAPEAEEDDESRAWQLLLLSARTGTALDAMTANLAQHLRRNPGARLADVAHTLQVGRKTFSQRRMLVCRDAGDALEALETLDPKRVLSAAQERGNRPVAFMFSGQGSQYVQMARELYETEAIFREQIDACAELLRPHLQVDLREILYPRQESVVSGQLSVAVSNGHHTTGNGHHTTGNGHQTTDNGQRTTDNGRLDQTQYAQPALFVVEYALAKLWMAWGIEPQAMIGHSIGEYVAACLSGVLSLEDALKLVAARGRMMQQLPSGAMLSVGLAEEQVRPLLGTQLSLAAVNGPGMCVVAGPTEALEALERRLAEQEVTCQRLRTSHAFHSAMMDPILDAFTRLVESVELHLPTIPYVSNVTGTWITAAEATDPRYWARHLRQAVRFGDGVRELMNDSARLLLEIGPGQTLTTLARRHLESGDERVIVSSLRRPQDRQSDVAFLLGALGKLWLGGAPVDWPGFYAHERRRRVPLPTYPFERQRYWVEPSAQATAAPARKGALHKRPDVGEWLYAPSWKRVDLPVATMAARSRILLLGDGEGLGARLARRLEQQGHTAISAMAGDRFEPAGERAYTIRPRASADYDALITDLRESGQLPETIVHLLNVGAADPARDGEEQITGFSSLLLLVQALGRQHVTTPLRLVVVSTQAQEVTGDEAIVPERATLLGLCKVIPQEYPNITCQSIDIMAPGSRQAARLLDRLAAELDARPTDPALAYRGGYRWVQAYEASHVEAVEGVPARLRQGGVYLITGGLGRIGLVLAEYLAGAVQAKLVLVGRSAFPQREAWDRWLVSHDLHDEVSRKIERLKAIEALGGEVLVAEADVASLEQMQEVLRAATARFGALHGVIHSAGMVGESFVKSIQETGAAESALHFRPKARGLEVLEALLEGQTLDFCLLQSSLSAVLGGLGMAAYAAANAYMDALTQRHNQASQVPWISVNWDGWQFDDQRGHLAGASATELTLTPEEGVEVFRRVLARSEGAQVIVSTGDLQARLERWVQREERPAPAGATTLHPRPNLQNAYVAPRDPIEQAIVGMWQNVLGIEQIGIHDDFFELGGHSLLATQLVSRLRDAYQVELPLRNLFETPTVAGLAALIREVGQAGSQANTAIPVLPRASDTVTFEELPLSFGQRRLWFLDQLEPGTPLYNNPAAVRLNGRLDVAALERSLNEIVRRHEVLRTSFGNAGGHPVLVVAPEMRVSLPIVDLRDRPIDEREATALRMAAAEGQQPFDLTRGPLLRVTLLRLDEEKYIVLLTMHHIVSDGWSTGVLIREVAALYDAFAGGHPSPLSALPVQYADFAAWQHQWLRGEVLEQQIAYWREHLSGELPVLELPTDRARPPIQSYNGASHWFTLPRDLLERLNALSQQEGATLFMTLVASFEALLHRYSGQDDLCIGTPIAGRTRAETEALIGFFVNLLVLRADLSGNPSFRELLRRVREDALGAYAHQDLPFEMLVDELQPLRDMSRTPLFQVIFVLQNAPMQSVRLPGLEVAPLDLDRTTEKYDLTLMMEEAPDGLRGLLNYNTDLFDAATIARMAGHLATLLESIVTDPDQQIAALPILPLAERYQLLVEWNNTRTGAPLAPCIHRLFEAQVERSPNAVAVVCEGAELTYAELNRRANQLARHLRALHVGPETLVGVCVERSLESIVSLLGILKAGGAYLPLDPAYPAERLAFMLEDARVAVLLTSQEQRTKNHPEGTRQRADSTTERKGVLHTPPPDDERAYSTTPPPDSGQPTVIDLDAEWETIAQQPATNLAGGAAGEHAAYVIYTSGSTGQPKGAVVTHEAIAAHCRDVAGYYQLDANDRVLQFASLNFDASLEQLLPPLLAGARVVLRGKDMWAPSEFHKQVRDYGLTVINPPTAYWHQLVQEWARAPELIPDGLRLVISGGDAMRPEILQLWQRTRLRAVRLLNAYGPTETTITATTFEVLAEASETPRRIPIGRPLANRTTYVLDKHGNPVPIGVPGELYIGGAGLARGYLNRPEQTDEKFVPNLFSAEPGARLYRTGDLVRYRPDGQIEFLGRVDHQVKIRGFRVELGEIEAALALHDEVRDAIVLAREDVPGDKRLVAYVVASLLSVVSGQLQPRTTDDGQWTTDNGQRTKDLRAFLKQKLPEFMVPSAFVLLDAWPMTPSGKVDRRALPAPDGSRLDQGQVYVAPRNPVEQQLAETWAQVLGVERVGIHDNFFELGGHSLLATQLASRLRESFEVEVPLRRLFETPTIAHLSLLIAQTQIAQEDEEDIDALLAELEELSDDDVQGLLAGEYGAAHT